MEGHIYIYFRPLFLTPLFCCRNKGILTVILLPRHYGKNLCVTPVSHTNYSSRFKVRLSVFSDDLGLRRHKGVVRRGGERGEVGERGEEES